MDDKKPARAKEARDKMLKRIAQLRAMTTANGASESEAMNAMKRATELMAEYEVSEAEFAGVKGKDGFSFDIGKSEGAMAGKGAGGKTAHEVWMVAKKIADLFSCKVITSRDAGGVKLIYVGDAPDRILAEFVTDLCRDAMDTGYNQWKRGKVGVSKAGYCLGLAERVNERIELMIKIRAAEVELSATGSNLPALIVNKTSEVQKKFHQLYPKIRTVSRTVKTGGSGGRDSYNAGQRAGDRIHLGGAIGKGSVNPGQGRLV